MKIALLVGLARQVEGEYCFVNVIKASRDAEILKKHMQENNLPNTDTFNGVQCVLEYGIIENVEVEDE